MRKNTNKQIQGPIKILITISLMIGHTHVLKKSKKCEKFMT